MKGFLVKFSKLLFVLALFLWAIVKIGGPGADFTLTFRDDKIMVVRDSYHIPTINAQTKQGAYYAFGYVQAEDRLFQLHTRRMAALGRLSEMSRSEKTLPIDKLMREIGMNRYSKVIAQRLREEFPESADVYEAYSQGINDFVATYGLPLEFYLARAKWEPWEPSHSFAMTLLFDWAQSHDYPNQFMRSFLLNEQNMTKEIIDEMFPYTDQNMIVGATTVTDDELKAGEEYEPFNNNEVPVFKPRKITADIFEKMLPEFLYESVKQGGSNCVVVSGNHTKSGRAMISADPHLEATMPSQIYLANMQYILNGTVKKVSGANLVGSFNMLLHMNYLSYSVTTSNMDVTDLYQETTNGTHYLLDGKWLPLKLIKEVIKVGDKELNHTIRLTHRGPIISNLFYQGKMFTPKQNLSVCWTGHNTNPFFVNYIITVQDVQNFEQLKVHAKGYTNLGPPTNFLFITKDDHYGHIAAGALPLRPNKLSGAYVKDGSTSAHDWIGVVPANQKLFHWDAPKGYFLNSNNKPASRNKKGYPGGQYTARANRASHVMDDWIAKKIPIDEEMLLKLQTDLVDEYCFNMLPKLLELLPRFAKYLSSKWDCSFGPESIEATWYEVFMKEYQTLVRPHPQIPVQGSITFNMYTMRRILRATPKDKQQIALLEKALQNTEAFLQNYFQDRPTRWGDLHVDYMPFKAFNGTILAKLYDRNFPGKGNFNTLNYARMLGLYNNDYRTNIRANVRFVRSYADPENIGSWILDAGQSETPLRSSYDNMWRNYQNDILLPIKPLWKHLQETGSQQHEL